MKLFFQENSPVLASAPIQIFKPQVGLWDLERDGITQSALGSFLLCPEKHRLSAVEGLSERRTRGCLAFGSLVHKCLEKVYTALMEGELEPDETAMLFFLSVVMQQQEREDREKALAGSDTIVDLATLEEVYGLAEGVLPGYVSRWVHDFADTEWLGLEETFDVPLKLRSGLTVRVRGKRDGRFRHKRDRKMWLFESKTKGRISDDAIMDRLNFDDQNMIYCWSMWQEFGEVPAGVVYNIIRTPQLRRKKDESLGGFAARIKSDVGSRPEHYFIRYRASITKSDLVRYEQDLASKLGQLERWSKGEFHYKNSSACTAYGMNCRFLPVCARNDRERFMVRTAVFPELEEVEVEED